MTTAIAMSLGEAIGISLILCVLALIVSRKT